MKHFKVTFKRKDEWVHALIQDQVDTKRQLGIHTDASFEIIRLLKETITRDGAGGPVYKKDTRVDSLLQDVSMQDKQEVRELAAAMKSIPETWVAGSVLLKALDIIEGPQHSRKRKSDN